VRGIEMRKTRTFNIKITDQDFNMIKELRDVYDLNLSSLLRDHMRQIYRDTVNNNTNVGIEKKLEIARNKILGTIKS
jgi:hypothetical protein